MSEQPVPFRGVGRPALLDRSRAELGECACHRVAACRLVRNPDLRTRRAGSSGPRAARPATRAASPPSLACRAGRPALAAGRAPSPAGGRPHARCPMRVPSSRRFPSTGRSPPAAGPDRRALPARRRVRPGRGSGSAGIAARTCSTTAGSYGGSVAEPGRELPLRDRVGDRRQVTHPGEVQLRGCRGQDVGVGDENVGPSRHDGAFRAGDDQDAAVCDESVDTAGGLDRDVTAAGALRGDLRDVGERAGADRDQQPVRTDLGDRALDGLLVGANRPRPELDDRAVPELFGEPIHDGTVRRAVRPAVAEDHRRIRRAVHASAIAPSKTEAPMRMSTSGRSAWPGARRRRENRRRVGHGDHVGRADQAGQR